MLYSARTKLVLSRLVELERAQNFRALSFFGYLASSSDLFWVVKKEGSSRSSSWSSLSFTQAQYIQHYFEPCWAGLTGWAIIRAWVVSGLELIQCELIFRPGPSSRVRYPFQLYRLDNYQLSSTETIFQTEFQNKTSQETFATAGLHFRFLIIATLNIFFEQMAVVGLWYHRFKF